MKFRIHDLFPILWIFIIQNLHQKMGFININRKNIWGIHVFLNHYWIFLHLLKDSFIVHLYFLNLKSFILIQNPTLKPLFKFIDSSKITWLINDNILVYRVVYSIPLNLFTIANEYVFDTFKIQLWHCFLWHISKCNTNKNMQMIYGRFVSTLNLFWCHVGNCLGRDLIMDICCNCDYLYLKFISYHHMLQHTLDIFNKCSILAFNYTILL